MRSCTISRRTVLAGGLGAGVLALAGGVPRARASGRTHAMRLGEAEITIVSDGVFTLPLSFVLPDKPAAEATAYLAAHGARPEFVGETNVVLVRSGKTVALIDTGGGSDFMPTLGKLSDTLDGAGLKPDDVTHVVFTHAHADHFWGVIDPFSDGSRWPNARHVMPQAERDFWLADATENAVPEALKGMAIGIKRRLKTLGDTMSTVMGDDVEIAPGIALIPTPGHTPGHMSVVVRSGSEELLIGGDALTHSIVSFAEPDWRWGSDFDWQQAAATRKRLLDRLASTKALITGYHLPWPGIGRVEKAGAAYRFVPIS